MISRTFTIHANEAYVTSHLCESTVCLFLTGKKESVHLNLSIEHLEIMQQVVNQLLLLKEQQTRNKARRLQQELQALAFKNETRNF